MALVQLREYINRRSGSAWNIKMVIGEPERYNYIELCGDLKLALLHSNVCYWPSGVSAQPTAPFSELSPPTVIDSKVIFVVCHPSPRPKLVGGIRLLTQLGQSDSPSQKIVIEIQRLSLVSF